MRFGYLISASAIASFLLVAPVMAASHKSLQDCNQLADPDRTIAGCTSVLAEGGLQSRSLAIAYYNRGLGWSAKVDYDRAIADFDEAIRIAPNVNVDNIYYYRALAWTYKGDPDRGIADFNELIRIDPKSAPAYGARGFAWAEKGEFDRAIADYNGAIRINPKLRFVYNNRATLWRDKGDYEKAIADDNEAIRIDPKFAQAYANRGEIWRLKGDLDRALEDQEQAIRLKPKKNPIAYVLRGDTERYKGEFGRALSDYDQALLDYPSYIAAFTGRGLTYEKMGDLVRARAEFQKALDSQSQSKADINKSSLETARARLAALDSGVAQPTIPISLSKATSATSIPTPAVAIPAVVPAAVNQGRRVALVIGNSAYQNVPALLNPQKDATAIAATLRNIGFEVTTSHDVTREKMVDSLRHFANEAENSDWAVVYYAGHGMEVGGVNYLIPVDAKIAVDRDIQYEAVPLSQVLNAADTAKKIKLVMLDACRDNPFTPRKTAAPEVVAASMSTSGAPITTRSSNGRGLAEVKVTGATLVVYAAKDGQVALDGEGGNSPFAVAIVQRVATPGVEINKVFRLVRDDVMEATAGRQEPYTYGSLPGKEDFFFVAK